MKGKSIRFAASKTLLSGVDIGGTKVSAGLVDARGKILLAARAPMVAHETPQKGLDSVFAALDAIFRDPRAGRVRGIGVSVPGWVDSARGVLIRAANIPCWRDFPLARRIERRYRLPVRIANDANLAALAEAAWGAGHGYRNLFYVTLGTGVGTGIVLDGRVYSGRTGAASEGGHVSIDFRGPLCGCGKRGCVETYVSGTAIARRARAKLHSPAARRSLLFRLAGGKIASVTAETVARAAARRDWLALGILHEAADRFANWLGNMIDLLEPDVIIVGGGMGKLMLSFSPRIRRALRSWSASPRHREIPIVAARYGSESALAGAAALGLAEFQSATKGHA